MKKQINTQTPVEVTINSDSKITVNGYTKEQLEEERKTLLMTEEVIDIYTPTDIDTFIEYSNRMTFLNAAIEYITFQDAAYNVFESVSLFAYDNPNDEDEETFPLGIGDNVVFKCLKKNGWCWVFADMDDSIYGEDDNQPSYTFNADDIHDFNCKEFTNFVASSDKAVRDKWEELMC